MCTGHMSCTVYIQSLYVGKWWRKSLENSHRWWPHIGQKEADPVYWSCIWMAVNFLWRYVNCYNTCCSARLRKRHSKYLVWLCKGSWSCEVAMVCTNSSIYRSAERALCVYYTWKLPPSLVKNPVMHAVSCLNICCTTALNVNIWLKVLFTGLCMNYKIELSLVFRDSIEV